MTKMESPGHNYYQKNKAKMQEYGKKWRAKNKAFIQKYREENKGKLRQYAHDYYVNHLKAKRAAMRRAQNKPQRRRR